MYEEVAHSYDLDGSVNSELASVTIEPVKSIVTVTGTSSC